MPNTNKKTTQNYNNSNNNTKTNITLSPLLQANDNNKEKEEEICFKLEEEHWQYLMENMIEYEKNMAVYCSKYGNFKIMINEWCKHIIPDNDKEEQRKKLYNIIESILELTISFKSTIYDWGFLPKRRKMEYSQTFGLGFSDKNGPRTMPLLLRIEQLKTLVISISGYYHRIKREKNKLSSNNVKAAEQCIFSNVSEVNKTILSELNKELYKKKQELKRCNNNITKLQTELEKSDNKKKSLYTNKITKAHDIKTGLEYSLARIKNKILKEKYNSSMRHIIDRMQFMTDKVLECCYWWMTSLIDNVKSIRTKAIIATKDILNMDESVENIEKTISDNSNSDNKPEKIEELMKYVTGFEEYYFQEMIDNGVESSLLECIKNLFTGKQKEIPINKRNKKKPRKPTIIKQKKTTTTTTDNITKKKRTKQRTRNKKNRINVSDIDNIDIRNILYDINDYENTILDNEDELMDIDIDYIPDISNIPDISPLTTPIVKIENIINISPNDENTSSIITNDITDILSFMVYSYSLSEFIIRLKSKHTQVRTMRTIFEGMLVSYISGKKNTNNKDIFPIVEHIHNNQNIIPIKSKDKWIYINGLLKKYMNFYSIKRHYMMPLHREKLDCIHSIFKNEKRKKYEIIIRNIKFIREYGSMCPEYKVGISLADCNVKQFINSKYFLLGNKAIKIKKYKHTEYSETYINAIRNVLKNNQIFFDVFPDNSLSGNKYITTWINANLSDQNKTNTIRTFFNVNIENISQSQILDKKDTIADSIDNDNNNNINGEIFKNNLLIDKVSKITNADSESNIKDNMNCIVSPFLIRDTSSDSSRILPTMKKNKSKKNINRNTTTHNKKNKNNIATTSIMNSTENKTNNIPSSTMMTLTQFKQPKNNSNKQPKIQKITQKQQLAIHNEKIGHLSDMMNNMNENISNMRNIMSILIEEVQRTREIVSSNTTYNNNNNEQKSSINLPESTKDCIKQQEKIKPIYNEKKPISSNYNMFGNDNYTFDISVCGNKRKYIECYDLTSDYSDSDMDINNNLDYCQEYNNDNDNKILILHDAYMGYPARKKAKYYDI